MTVSDIIPATDDNPADALSVQLTCLFGKYPSCSLSIQRHGVDEKYFSREELCRVAKAILALDQRLEPK
ncbi:MAG TPA: hypothetical protein VGF13_16615 [Verrucomicrobiae bacterium]|jgi:hypothetical protein